MFQWLPIAPAQVKVGNIYENLLNEIRQIIYSMYRAKKLLKSMQQYHEFNKGIIQNWYYIYEFFKQ